MRRAEEAIDKVLAGLRDVEAPIGMERRILGAVQDRAAAKAAPRWPRLRAMWLAKRLTDWSATRVWGVGLAGLLAVCGVISVIDFGHHRSEHLPAQSKMRAVPVEALSPVVSGEGVRSALLPLPASTGRLKGQGRARRVVGESGSLAVRDMRAVSQPAPAMPLTEEERLLLRVVHRGDPEELAMLDPVVRAARDAKEKAEFQKFFGQATAGQTTTGDNE